MQIFLINENLNRKQFLLRQKISAVSEQKFVKFAQTKKGTVEKKHHKQNAIGQKNICIDNKLDAATSISRNWLNNYVGVTETMISTWISKLKPRKNEWNGTTTIYSCIRFARP